MEEVNMEEVTPTPIESEDDREGIKEEVLLKLLKRQGEPEAELEEVEVVVEDEVEDVVVVEAVVQQTSV